MRERIAMLVTAGLGAGCAAEELGQSTHALEPDEACVVIGLGELPAGDELEGQATELVDGTVSGVWDHFTPERTVTICEPCPGHGHGHGRGHGHGHEPGHPGHEHGRGHCHDAPVCHDELVRDHFEGAPDEMECHANGGDDAIVQGEGTWNGAPGYTFVLDVLDRERSGGDDVYTLTVFAPDASIEYAVSDVLAAGDIDVQIP